MTKANFHHLIPWVLVLCFALAGYQLWQQQVKIKAQLKASQQQVYQIAMLSQRYLAISGNYDAIQKHFKQRSSAQDWLLASAKQQGLNISLQGNDTQNPSQPIKLSFSEVHFNQFIRWIHTTETSNNLVVTKSLLSSHENAGKVSGTITFEMN